VTPSSGPAGVLFDLDGTLFDSERHNVESVALAMRRLGREITREEREFIVPHSWNEIHALLTRNHGVDVSREDLIAAAVREKRGLIAAWGMPAMPGAVALVRRLAARLPLAIVTGSSRVEVREAVAALDLGACFRLLLAAEDYARGKPDPEPYATAMQRLGLSPARTIVVEDTPPGILSGVAAGAKVIAVRAGNTLGYDLSAAHVVVDTLDQVTDDLLASLAG
jgi:HAD superfamily hydrolase (TIGR01509 family)